MAMRRRVFKPFRRRFGSSNSRFSGSAKRSRGHVTKVYQSLDFGQIDEALNAGQRTFAQVVFNGSGLVLDPVDPNAATYDNRALLWLGCNMYIELSAVGIEVNLDPEVTFPILGAPTTCALDFALFRSDLNEYSDAEGNVPVFNAAVAWSAFDERFLDFTMFDWQRTEQLITRRQLPWNGFSNARAIAYTTSANEPEVQVQHDFRLCRTVRVRKKRWVSQDQGIHFVFDTTRWIDLTNAGIFDGDVTVGSKVMAIDFEHFVWRP